MKFPSGRAGRFNAPTPCVSRVPDPRLSLPLSLSFFFFLFLLLPRTLDPVLHYPASTNSRHSITLIPFLPSTRDSRPFDTYNLPVR